MQCTTSPKGPSVSILPDEALHVELRERQQTPEGRAKLRERVAVEHTLAHVGRWQGKQARYRGLRKNLFDLRRCAVVHNLHILARTHKPRQGPGNHDVQDCLQEKNLSERKKSRKIEREKLRYRLW